MWVAMLDLRKAFDTVWTNGLLYRLYEAGIGGKAWRIIKDMYNGAECSIKIGSKLSEWFQIKQGVHQGAPMSMLLFQLYINPLLKELKQSGKGAMVTNINVNVPSFADDMGIAQSSCTYN